MVTELKTVGDHSPGLFDRRENSPEGGVADVKIFVRVREARAHVKHALFASKRRKLNPAVRYRGNRSSSKALRELHPNSRYPRPDAPQPGPPPSPASATLVPVAPRSGAASRSDW